MSEGEGKGPPRPQGCGGPSTAWRRNGELGERALRGGGGAMIARSVRLLVEGEVQDTPFAPALARELKGRSASLRRVGGALEVRAALKPRENGERALQAMQAAVVRAAKSSETKASVFVARAEEFEVAGPGTTVLPASLGSSETAEIDPATWPDLAPCAACSKEFSSEGRRHGYLRTECPACGPRYAHAIGPPLTRDRYGMAPMPACPACKAEAADPSDRRFAFERNSCPNCGPTLTLQPPSGAPYIKGALRRAAERLAAGDVVAVQTPYGFVAAATLPRVGALRVEIAEEFAPISVVVPTAAAAKRLAELTASEALRLFGAAAPEVAAAPLTSRETMARELSVFGGQILLRAPDCPALSMLTHEVGPLAVAGASRGGAVLPAAAAPGTGLPTALWLTDAGPMGDPVPPARGYFLGRQWVLLAHGRGSLPAKAGAAGAGSALAFGGGTSAFGAAAFYGTAYLTGSAGPSARADTSAGLRRLISRAAAMSPAGRADTIEFVAASADEGTPSRLAAEETAADAGCEVRVVSSAAARAASGFEWFKPDAPATLVLNAAEPVAEGDKWLGVQETGGDIITADGRKLVGGIAPFHVVDAPGGRADLAAPLAALFDSSGLVLEGHTRDNAPILELLRKRATTSSSFVQLVDGTAAALGLVPRRAPAGAGVAEAARAALDPRAGHRYRFSPTLTKARGSKQLDAAGLVVDLASHRQSAHGREGGVLPWERRAALCASFLVALLDGLAASARAGLGRGGRVAITGSAFAERAVAQLAVERLRLAGLEPVIPAGVPLLDGALPIGQLRVAAEASKPTKRRR